MDFSGISATDYANLMELAQGDPVLQAWLQDNTFEQAYVDGEEVYIFHGDDDMTLIDLGYEVLYFTYQDSMGYQSGF